VKFKLHFDQRFSALRASERSDNQANQRWRCSRREKTSLPRGRMISTMYYRSQERRKTSTQAESQRGKGSARELLFASAKRQNAGHFRIDTSLLRGCQPLFRFMLHTIRISRISRLQCSKYRDVTTGMTGKCGRSLDSRRLVFETEQLWSRYKFLKVLRSTRPF
jgi:hypothetical protein